MLIATGRGTEVRQLAPARCPSGHPLRPPNVRVAYLPCSCAGVGGHHSWTCVECGHTTYDPMHVDPSQAGGKVRGR